MQIINKNHSGQVALIMVLVMTVISAVAVSVASRSTVETRVQQLSIDNTQAILTAQAGLEDALSQNTEVTGSLGEGKAYSVTKSDAGSTSVSTDKIDTGETLEINLVGAVGVTGVKIYWKPAVPGGKPAIFVTDVQASKGIDYAYDTDGTNGFTRVSTGGSLGGVSYDYLSPSIPVTSGTSLKLRVTALVSPAIIGVEPVGGTLPPQSTNFKSVANLTTGQTTLKYGVEYLESKSDMLPSVFDYVLFSGGSIIQ